MVATPITAAGVSPRKTVAVTMVKKLDEITILLAGVSTAVSSPTTEVASRMANRPRPQLESPLSQMATTSAAASAASSRAMTLLLGRPGIRVVLAAHRGDGLAVRRWLAHRADEPVEVRG